MSEESLYQDAPKPRCATCRFGLPDWHSETKIYCRRHAPPPHPLGEQWTWPTLNCGGWCGDYEPDKE
jgi:hypothetical protein